MSDYMFMLENHLTAAQSRVVADVQAAAAEANVNVFLTGGAIRDMLGGFPIRDLDFTVEGNGVKLGRTIASRNSAEIVLVDDVRKAIDLRFPGGAVVEIGTAKTERYPKPGAKPQVTPASIHDDLRGRDFTVNAIALSLNRASRGLLLDPTNGLADLERREIRAVGIHTLYDSPIRLYRMLRLKVRLGFEIAERTQSQYANAREAEVEKLISTADLARELHNAAAEPNVADVIETWDRERLLVRISPVLTGPKINNAGLHKLQKARHAIPFDVDVQIEHSALLFDILTEKLSPKERASVVEGLRLDKGTVADWLKLEAKAKKAEKELSSTGLQKPSHIYNAVAKVPGEVIVYLLAKSQQRVVQDRIRNYFGKYLPAAQEITDLQVIEAGYTAGTPKFVKAKAEMIAKRLDARPKKPPVETAPAPPPPSPMRGRAPSIY